MTYQRIYNAHEIMEVGSSVLVIDWDKMMDVNLLKHRILQNRMLKFCIHRIKAEFIADVNILVKETFHEKNHYFFIDEKINASREERFDISTFMGKMSSSKETRHIGLRNLYSYWSYSILLAREGLSDEHYDLLSNEIKYVASLRDFKQDNEWLLFFNKIFQGPDCGEVNLPKEIYQSTTQYRISRLLQSLQSRLRRRGKREVDLRLDEIEFVPIAVPNPRSWKKVLITGWYGTETAGDKAILGEVIHRLRTYNPQLEVLISSIDLRVSWQTRIEMDLDVQHIPIQEMCAALEDPKLDAVVMGGGPLMESSQILPIAKLFHGAALKGMNRVIFGCGVGPIHTASMSEQIAHIIKVSNVAFYRDQESLDYAIRLGGDETNSKLACDPATAFINRWREANPKKDDSKRISTMLREQTAEYETKADIDSQNMVFPGRIAEVLVDLKKNSSSLEELNLIPMHVYWRGNDDRLLNQRIADQVSGKLNVQSYLPYKGIYELIESLSQSRLAIAMRYHGHVFSIALNIPFISLDYTGEKGKVSNLMQRIGLKNYSVKFEEFTPSVLNPKLKQIEANSEIETVLKAKTQELTNTLEKAYHFFWN